MSFRRWFPVLVVAVWAGSPATAQTLTSPVTAKTVLPWDDYATQVLRDGWDMKERTDVGWFTWGIDLPSSNMTSKRITQDGYGQSIFTGVPLGSSNDPSIFLLDPHQPLASRTGKVGANYPVRTSQYTRLLVKMRVANEIKPPQFSQIGTVPVMQVYWSRDTIYHDPVLRPTGGTYTTVDANGNQVGTAFTAFNAEPFGAMEGGRYVIYAIPLGSLSGLQALNPNIAKWKNVNANNPAVDVNWGASSAIIADSLRFKPVNLNGSQAGTVDIDWVRLVAPGADAPETVSWTGGGAYDIVVSEASDCGASNGNYAVLAYSRTSGFQFNPQMLPNGRYYVGLRDRLTANGSDSPATRQIRACSASVGGSYSVLDYPAFAFTAPDPTGSGDDFATVFLGNTWDFLSTNDIDLTRNIASGGVTTIAAERPDATYLGTIPVYFGMSTAGSPGTDNVGDPHVYTLFSTRRGLNHRIDTSRYRLFTLDMGVDRERDLYRGSILRLVWHIAGETWFWDGATVDAENVTTDIPLRHLRKGSVNFDTQSTNYVLDRIQFDLADRWRVPLELAPNGSPSRTGWSNTAVQCGGTGCKTYRVQPFNRVGVDNFRIDPHEFDQPTAFYIREAKLAAHERTGANYTVRWTHAMPAWPTSGTYANAANWRVRIWAVRTKPPSSPGAGDGSPSSPITANCSANPGVDTFLLTPSGAEPTLGSGQWVWNTWNQPGLVSGGLYFLCAGLIVPGFTTASAYTFTEFPVVFAPSAGTEPLPRLYLDRSTVWMAARHSGANNPPNLVSRTPPQTVNVIQVGGSSAVSWAVDVCENYDPSNPPTCTGSVSYVAVSKTSGTGTSAFTVQVQDSSVLPQSTGPNVIGLVLRVREIVNGATANSPQYVQLYITIFGPNEATSGPLGQVDTPAQNAQNLRGAIGVSGWAVDDVGLQSVKVYRNCLPANEAPVCVTGLVPGSPSTPLVYIGDAVSVAGARPDVEASFPQYPGSNRAGWGYAILSNMLPRTTGPFAPNGGQGPLTIYVIATDVEGNRRVLGRTWVNDSTPTQVTMDNDNIARPFGVLDTPTQGGTASGQYAVFGWALTPDNGGGIIIPTNGTTMWMYMDGVPIGTVTYNQCRGTVGNPPPPGVFCNDDVANIFGNATPQPPLTPRTSNPTRHRNLDAGRGPQGSFVLDTTRYANGLHVVAWSVTDSAGRVEGIGERNFIIQNGVTGFVPDEGEAAPAGRAGPELGKRVADLAAFEALDSAVGVRRGYVLDAAFETAAPRGGALRVETGLRERLELALPNTLSGSTWDGYLVAHGRLAPLPLGSHLDPAGRLYWQPSAGFLGEYDLLFVRQNADGRRETLPVQVTIGPTPGRDRPGTAAAGRPAVEPDAGARDPRR